jgi:hypothetical protein
MFFFTNPAITITVRYWSDKQLTGRYVDCMSSKNDPVTA